MERMKMNRAYQCPSCDATDCRREDDRLDGQELVETYNCDNCGKIFRTIYEYDRKELVE